MICKYCNKQTNNPKFCSRSCSVSYTNKINPKRRPEGKCTTCSTSVLARRKYCNQCDPRCRGDITIEQAIYHKHGTSSAFALIRTRARAIAQKLNMNSCKICGYNKHVEIAHITPITKFPKNTLVSIVNAPNNLISLCRNCHWEMDHGLTKI